MLGDLVATMWRTIWWPLSIFFPHVNHMTTTRWFPSWTSKDHFMDHSIKLGEHRIFFNNKKINWNFIFHYIILYFHYIFNIIDHEIKIRFYLMFYVKILKKLLNDVKERNLPLWIKIEYLIICCATIEG
jgi:hypothetical protein